VDVTANVFLAAVVDGFVASEGGETIGEAYQLGWRITCAALRAGKRR
jgi:hypothetical protein